MIKCKKCGAVYGKVVETCFYCGAMGSIEEIEDVNEEIEEVAAKEIKEEVPKKKRGRKKKSE